MTGDGLFDVRDHLQQVVDALHAYPGWPRDDTKDRAFAQQILSEFPGLDLESEISAWRVWMMDHEQKKEVRPRARVHTWLRRARGDFDRRGDARAGAGTRRTSTAPRAADAFGATSDRLTGW